MIRRLFLLTALGVLLSGCYISPMALVGPAMSGFSTASLIQSGLSTGANYMVKKSTGKTLSQHAIEAILSSNETIIKQSYFPKNDAIALIIPKARPTR